MEEEYEVGCSSGEMESIVSGSLDGRCGWYGEDRSEGYDCGGDII